jgi:hypothetical protein
MLATISVYKVLGVAVCGRNDIVNANCVKFGPYQVYQFVCIHILSQRES